MPFSAVVGHEAAIRSLQRALRAERLPTGYLFTGPAHIGKTTLAKAFAQAANCETPLELPEGPEACGACPTCLRIEREAYADVRVLRPRRKVDIKGEDDDEKLQLQAELDDALIDVKLMERLRMDAAASAMEARRRVYIITQADAMNAEAANRFLKTLEEPPPGLTFILTTAQPSRLLPTIISRCQVLALHALHREDLKSALSARFPHLSPERSEQIASLSAGALGRALSLAEKPDLLTLREELLGLAASLPGLEPWEALRCGERLLDLTERWWLAEHPDDAGRDFLKHAHDTAVRAELRTTLAVLHTWFRDLLAAGNPALLTNADHREAVELAAASYTPEAALGAVRALEELREDLSQNPNLRLAAEALFVRLLSLKR